MYMHLFMCLYAVMLHLLYLFYFTIQYHGSIFMYLYTLLS